MTADPRTPRSATRGSLFWRIFGALWLATVLMLLAFAWFSTRDFERAEIPGLGITRLEATMEDLLARTARVVRREDADAGELASWLRSAGAIGPVAVYVIAKDGREALDRTPPSRVARTAAALLDPDSALKARRFNDDRLRARLVRSREGELYAAVAVPQGRFLSRLVSYRPRTFWITLAVALTVTTLVSLALAGYVTAPLQRIRRSTRRFAEGDLDARVGPLPFGRSAEIVALADEFDGMAERIRALVESHRRLVRDVSHELRSPLARLRVALELARGDATPASRSALDRIELECARLDGMLTQALQLSRLETALPHATERIDVAAMLHAIVANAEYEAQSQGRRIALTSDAPLTVEGIAEDLASAIENVVRNALKYTADARPVEVSLQRVAVHAEIRVRDHGPGVADAELGRIFEPFYRTDAARHRASGGTGLGLAIARRAVERHRGSIVAHNAEGGGLEVILRLPLAT